MMQVYIARQECRLFIISVCIHLHSFPGWPRSRVAAGKKKQAQELQAKDLRFPGRPNPHCCASAPTTDQELNRRPHGYERRYYPRRGMTDRRAPGTTHDMCHDMCRILHIYIPHSAMRGTQSTTLLGLFTSSGGLPELELFTCPLPNHCMMDTCSGPRIYAHNLRCSD